MYQDQGLNQRAEPLHREALDIRRKVLGHRAPRDGRQPQRPGVGPAAERRSRWRGGAAETVAGAEHQDPRRRSPEHRRQPARPRADCGESRRLPGRRIGLPPGARAPAQGARGQPPGDGRHAQQPRAIAARAAALRRSRRRPAGSAEHHAAARSATITSWWRSTPSTSRRSSWRETSLRQPRACCAKGCGSGRALRVSSRSAGGRCARTTGVSAPRGACSAPASWPNDATPKPRTCCSTHVVSSRPCPHRGGAEMKVAIARLIELYVAWGKPDKAASFRAQLGS